MDPIIIEPYNPGWKKAFEVYKEILEKHLGHLSVFIEHVGSTAVPELPAKPVIDIDIVLDDIEEMAEVIRILETLGYKHNGNQGIEGREAFKTLDECTPYDSGRTYLFKHHLYACHKDAIAYKNHVIIKEHLLNNPEDMKAYGNLKWVLSKKYKEDRLKYTEAKTEFILNILSQYDFEGDSVDAIRLMNRIDKNKVKI